MAVELIKADSGVDGKSRVGTTSVRGDTEVASEADCLCIINPRMINKSNPLPIKDIQAQYGIILER